MPKFQVRVLGLGSPTQTIVLLAFRLVRNFQTFPSAKGSNFQPSRVTPISEVIQKQWKDHLWDASHKNGHKNCHLLLNWIWACPEQTKKFKYSSMPVAINSAIVVDDRFTDTWLWSSVCIGNSQKLFLLYVFSFFCTQPIRRSDYGQKPSRKTAPHEDHLCVPG